MKTSSPYFATCVLALLLIGCTGPGKQLIGAWSSHDQFSYGQQRCEFFKDGTCFVEQGQRISGTWSALDDGRIKVTVTIFGGPSITQFASVTGDELFIDEGVNRRSAYVRENSPKAADIRAAINKAISDREIRIEAEKRALADRLAARQREEARQREAEQIAQARQREAEQIAQAKREESDRITHERQEEAQRAINAGFAAYKRKLYKQAISEYETAWQLGNPHGANNLAGIYAGCSDSSYHNGKKAVDLALQATKLRPDEVGYQLNLAAAYARDNQFEQAIKTQIRALSMRQTQEGEAVLKLYREHKAYQEP